MSITHILAFINNSTVFPILGRFKSSIFLSFLNLLSRWSLDELFTRYFLFLYFSSAVKIDFELCNDKSWNEDKSWLKMFQWIELDFGC